MPHGVHTSKRPSGCKQRKSKKKKHETLKSLPGSMLQYLKKPTDATDCNDLVTTVASRDIAQTDLPTASSTCYDKEQPLLNVEKEETNLPQMEVDDLRIKEKNNSILDCFFMEYTRFRKFEGGNYQKRKSFFSKHRWTIS